MSNDPVCPRGGVCVLRCHGLCAKPIGATFGATLDLPEFFTLPPLVTPGSLAAELQNLREENASLRADVMALWQRLGDVISLFTGRECMPAEHQEKLRNARALHALWKDEPDE